MGVSNLEARIKKLENTSATEFGTPTNSTLFPVRKLMLTEERSHDENGASFPVLVATWDKPAGVLIPDSIRLIHNDTTISLSGSATSYRMSGYTIGTRVIVKVTAVYSHGNSSTAIAEKTITGDATPPSMPTNLTVSGGFRTLTLSWENPTAEDFSHVEIWESVDSDDISTAERIAQAYGTEFVRSNCGVLETRWYWIRALDVNGNFSDFTSPSSGTTTAIAMEDVPENTITESMLISELSSEIDKISTIEADVSSVRTVDLPSYEQRIANRIDEVNDSIMAQVNTYADGTIDAMLDASEAISAVRDAGIITDPETGLTSIYALDAYKTANDARVSTVEVDLNAVESTLVSKVTLAQVDERIAGAVFGEAGELLLSGMDARMVTVEEGLDAVEGTLTEKATVIEVGALGGRIGTAESRLDGHDSEIALLATSQELDAVESRVTTAELNIDALEGSITQTVISSVTGTQDEEELLAQGLVDAMLNDREAKAKTESALAIAESELYAHVSDEMEAEAGQRLLLAAKVDNNTAAIQTESVVRASADSAMASQITTLQATAGDNTAAIQIVEDVRTGEVNVFRQATAPTTGMITGDLWIDNTEVVHRYEGGQWVSKVGTPVYDLLKTAIAQYVVKTQTVTGDGQLKVAGFGLYNDATTGSEFAILADKFYVYAQKEDGSSYSNMQVFTVDTTTTPPTVGINGNLIVDGSIVGEKIFSGAKIQLGDGGELITGAGSIVQMSSGVILLDSVNGVIQVKDPENITTGDFVKIETGDITTYKYINGSYAPMKSLRKMATGVATNNVTTTLPGAWPSIPEIIVSPKQLQSFVGGAYANSNQSMELAATNISRNSTTGVVTFVPQARLVISAGSGTVTPPASGSGIIATGAIGTSGTFYSGTASPAIGATTLTISASCYGQAGEEWVVSGAGTYSYYANMTNVSYALYVEINGSSHLIKTGKFNRAVNNVSTEPSSALYAAGTASQTFIINGSVSTIRAYAVFTKADAFVSMDTSAALYGKVNKCWIKINSISYALSGSTQIAAGTLNYMAISE